MPGVPPGPKSDNEGAHFRLQSKNQWMVEAQSKRSRKERKRIKAAKKNSRRWKP